MRLYIFFSEYISPKPEQKWKISSTISHRRREKEMEILTSFKILLPSLSVALRPLRSTMKILINNRLQVPIEVTPPFGVLKKHNFSMLMSILHCLACEVY